MGHAHSPRPELYGSSPGARRRRGELARAEAWGGKGGRGTLTVDDWSEFDELCRHLEPSRPALRQNGRRMLPREQVFGPDSALEGALGLLLKARLESIAGAWECPSCESLVSADRSTCPHCGRPSRIALAFERADAICFRCGLCFARRGRDPIPCPSCGKVWKSKTSGTLPRPKP